MDSRAVPVSASVVDDSLSFPAILGSGKGTRLNPRYETAPEEWAGFSGSPHADQLAAAAREDGAAARKAAPAGDRGGELTALGTTLANPAGLHLASRPIGDAISKIKVSKKSIDLFAHRRKVDGASVIDVFTREARVCLQEGAQVDHLIDDVARMATTHVAASAAIL